MSIRVLNIRENTITTFQNVKNVQNRIRYFRIVFHNGTFRDYPFKNYDHFPA
jgi:hypothetical protein